MDYIIRNMYEREYPLLASFLYEAIFVPEGLEAPPKSIIKQPALQVYIRDFGSQKDDRALLAEHDGTVVGVVWARIMNDYGHINDLTPSLAVAVREDHRGLGIGTALMAKMLIVLKESGHKQTSLAVQKANYAFRMYQKLGFKTVDENEVEYIMMKML